MLLMVTRTRSAIAIDDSISAELPREAGEIIDEVKAKTTPAEKYFKVTLTFGVIATVPLKG